MSRGEIRNKELYTALVNTYPDVQVVNSGNPGSYTYPPQKGSGLRRGNKTKVPLGRVEEWGEIYALRCPICQDNKPRLYISHYTGAKAYTKEVKDKKTGKLKKGSPVKFVIVSVCHNERCNVSREVQAVFDLAGEISEFITHAPTKYKGGVIDSVQLPVNHSLFDPCVPASVLDYIAARGYAPDYLQRTFDIRYMPPGTYMWPRETDGKVVNSWDHSC